MKKIYPINEKIAAFCFSTIIFLLLHHSYEIVDFLADSSVYWELSRPEVLIDFPHEIRGYFYPLLLSPARWLDIFFPISHLPYRIFSSVLSALFLSVFLPDFYVHLYGGKTTLPRRVLPSIFVAIFFPGILLYPLSDFPAFILLIFSISFIEKSYSHNTTAKKMFFVFLAGIFLGGTYNTRTIYIFSIIPILLYFATRPFFSIEKENIGYHAKATLAILLGLLIASLPQIIINKKNYDSYTPAVTSSEKIFSKQLKWGIAIQKYSTTIDPEAPRATMFYIDKKGIKILTTAGLESSTGLSFKEYLELVKKNPATFFAIYIRHVVAGLDVRDGEMYVSDYDDRKDILSIINFFILFFGIWLFFMKTGNNQAAIDIKSSLVWLAAILAPVAAIIPGAMETRFFLPIHLLIYCAVAFKFDYRWIRTKIYKHPIQFMLALFFTALPYFKITLAAQSSLRYAMWSTF